jgi:polysaccharide export outer membrane protein
MFTTSTAPSASAAAFGTALALLCGGPAAADGSSPTMVSQAALTTASASTVGADYRIGPNDQLDVNVFDIPDVSRSVQVDAGGKVVLPLIGEVQASGKTVDQLSSEIAGDLKQHYVKHPLVTVTVKDAVSERVTIDGAVLQPGTYPLAGPTTLMQALDLAKGADDKTADYHKVAVYRLVDGRREGATYDLAAIRAGKATDPPVYGRDIIVVPNSGSKAFWHGLVEIAPALSWVRP